MSRTNRLLLHLSDSEWHFKGPPGVGVNTVNLCIDQGFVKIKRFNIRRIGDEEIFRISMHITKKGRKKLENNPA